VDKDLIDKVRKIPATSGDTFRAITEVYAAAIRSGDSSHYAQQKTRDFIDFMSVPDLEKRYE
jgi:hypothetical protein